MPLRSLRSAVLLGVLGLAAPCALAAANPAAPAKPAAVPPAVAKSDTAIFAGGCFWCMETQFKKFPGVLSVTSGYTGGREANPTYEQVSSHRTGHREAVRVVFDPKVVTYSALLNRFWYGIDPTQADGQFYDVGESYRTAIYYRGDEQRRLALDSKRALERSNALGKPIVTDILPATAFWPAEDYHQEFYRKDPERYRSYREGSGRDERLRRLWGDKAAKPLVH
jgi:peptide-methionine (S)-S-oxide reductase